VRYGYAHVEGTAEHKRTHGARELSDEIFLRSTHGVYASIMRLTRGIIVIQETFVAENEDPLIISST